MSVCFYTHSEDSAGDRHNSADWETEGGWPPACTVYMPIT